MRGYEVVAGRYRRVYTVGSVWYQADSRPSSHKQTLSHLNSHVYAICNVSVFKSAFPIGQGHFRPFCRRFWLLTTQSDSFCHCGRMSVTMFSRFQFAQSYQVHNQVLPVYLMKMPLNCEIMVTNEWFKILAIATDKDFPNLGRMWIPLH